MDKQELLASIRECEKASPEKLCAMRAEIARLTAERDAERAGREKAERVAVWALKRGAFIRSDRSIAADEFYFPPGITDADLFRALVEACEGGRDGD